MRSQTHTPRKLVLALGVLACAVLAAEVAHRLWFYGPGGLSPARLASVRPLGETGFTTEARWPLVEFRLKPGVAGWFKLRRFETSSEGLRDREYARARPQGTLRVAVVGDSYTMGSGVALEETYHALLEERLNAAGDGRSYEFINFGVGGYSLLHELGLIEHVVLDWEPDLILLALTWNDAEPPPPSYFEDSPRRVRARTARTSYWRLTLLDRFLKPAGVPEAVGSHEQGIRAALGPAAELDGSEEYVPVVLGRIGEVCAAAGVPVLCVYLSTGDTEAMRAFAGQFEPAARAAGFGFLDTCSLFAGIDRGDIIVMPNDGHPNARSHELFANALEEVLRTDGWLDR